LRQTSAFEGAGVKFIMKRAKIERNGLLNLPQG